VRIDNLVFEGFKKYPLLIWYKSFEIFFCMTISYGFFSKFLIEMVSDEQEIYQKYHVND